jgi:hypothetical protein
MSLLESFCHGESRVHAVVRRPMPIQMTVVPYHRG